MERTTSLPTSELRSVETFRLWLTPPPAPARPSPPPSPTVRLLFLRAVLPERRPLLRIFGCLQMGPSMASWVALRQCASWALVRRPPHFLLVSLAATLAPRQNWWRFRWAVNMWATWALSSGSPLSPILRRPSFLWLIRAAAFLWQPRFTVPSRSFLPQGVRFGCGGRLAIPPSWRMTWLIRQPKLQPKRL